ncbi:hypothetical protein RirG_034350 [Rhizophagus irregularis DAOM 197198w]|uniref:Uncharacterized protein n=1 Tax=Rhizophagus irregularis (strain DAOM 197198w) TaxID=1432141 RepID=A0A015K9N3_RHIIW|nr:hypothetical protein RirG_034350 [Rhizophagus irregularis DAOM 197198w]
MYNRNFMYPGQSPTFRLYIFHITLNNSHRVSKMSYEFDELRQENARLKAENMELRQKLNARNNDK